MSTVTLKWQYSRIGPWKRGVLKAISVHETRGLDLPVETWEKQYVMKVPGGNIIVKDWGLIGGGYKVEIVTNTDAGYRIEEFKNGSRISDKTWYGNPIRDYLSLYSDAFKQLPKETLKNIGL